MNQLAGTVGMVLLFLAALAGVVTWENSAPAASGFTSISQMADCEVCPREFSYYRLSNDPNDPEARFAVLEGPGFLHEIVGDDIGDRGQLGVVVDGDPETGRVVTLDYFAGPVRDIEFTEQLYLFQANNRDYSTTTCTVLYRKR